MTRFQYKTQIASLLLGELSVFIQRVMRNTYIQFDGKVPMSFNIREGDTHTFNCADLQ